MTTKLGAWFGKVCEARVGRKTTTSFVFDWDAIERRDDFVDTIFGDCDVPGDFPELIGRGGRGSIVWKSRAVVPFALAGVDTSGKVRLRGASHPQFGALWLVDRRSRGASVYSIEVDGTAVPARAPRRIGALADVEITEAAPREPKPEAEVQSEVVPLDAAARKLLAGLHGEPYRQPFSDARKLLARVSGLEDCGFHMRWGKRFRRRGSRRNPHWIPVLVDELTRAFRRNESAAADLLAGALGSFGDDGALAVASALRPLLATYPRKRLQMWTSLVFPLLAVLGSDAAADIAVDIVRRTPSPDDRWSEVSSALVYLASYARPADEAALTKAAARLHPGQPSEKAMARTFAKAVARAGKRKG